MPSLIQRWRMMFRPNVYIYSLGSDAPTQVLNYTAARLYQSQGNLKAVVDFLANSIAQLPLKVYRRDGENNRQRDRDSAAARLIWKPNSVQTEFEFMRALAAEYLVFGCVYLWVIPDANTESGWSMWIVPTDWVVNVTRASAYAESSIRIMTKQGGDAVDIPAEEFVSFKTYSPGNPGGYVSPISGLRQTLEEQIEAGNFRKELWHSSGRLNAQVLRPANVERWDDATRKKWVAAFREAWGAGGSKAGSIPLLEDGMEIKPFQTSFREAQWTESVKLSREEVAAAYRVNPSLIWHSGTQTYASSKDNSRALYAECLGPDLQMIQQRINSFLLPMIGANPDTYVEFDLNEKLKGSFEERASIIQSAVGGPWMTRNEARADNNLPPVEGGDELIVPLNVIQGGQASPQDTHMDAQEPMAIQEPTDEELLNWYERMQKAAKACQCPACKSEPTLIRVKSRSSQDEDERMAEVLKKFWKRQAGSVLSRLGAKSAEWWDKERWDKELAEDIQPVIQAIADAHGKEVADAIGSTYNVEQTRKYLQILSEGRAAAINESTRKHIQEVLDAEDEADEEDEDEITTPADVFEQRQTSGADRIGRALALTAAGWAANHEAPQQAEQQGIEKTVEKMWVTGSNPRPEHAMMDGETVGIDDTFSNGCAWPGDENGDPDTTCGCNCSTEIIITVG